MTVLKAVDVIAAEDTRHTRRLTHHYGIDTPMIAFHEHNESAVASELLARMHAGASVALVSDAGTPLVNDPGFGLVRMARECGMDVVPIPGACAIIAALSVSGLPTDRFTFEGFAPRTQTARRAWLETLKQDSRTVVFYESSHRVLSCVEDIARLYPPEREIVVARELTKIHETVVKTTVGRILEILAADSCMQKGEFVILIQGAPATQNDDALTPEQRRILTILLKSCTVKTAAAVAAEITGARRRVLYDVALTLTDASQGQPA